MTKIKKTVWVQAAKGKINKKSKVELLFLFSLPA